MLDQNPGAYNLIRGDIDIFNSRPGWLVGQIRAPGLSEPLKVIGSLPDDEPLDGSVFSGVMELDPKRGELQFRLRGVVDTNLSREQLRAYLSSGLVWHVGPVIADSIIAAFGDATLPVLIENPERLEQVRGLGPGMVPGIRQSLAMTMPLAGIVGLLAPYGVNRGVCRAIVRKFGSRAAAAIRANPWRLSMDFAGVGFRTADAIALKMGFSPDAPERAEAALVHTVGLETRDGHTITPRKLLIVLAAKLLEPPKVSYDYDYEEEIPEAEILEEEPEPVVDADLTRVLSEALERLLNRAILVETRTPPGITRAEIASAEQNIAATIAGLLSSHKAGRKGEVVVSDEDLALLETNAGIVFDETQRAAVTGALSRGVTILTGSPGTGKTTVIRSICDLADWHGLSVALMSFTGKAAKVMSEATDREATTIHRYLRFIPGSGFQGPELAADVVVVDEVSMLDVALGSELCRWLASATRLVLVGDVDQLPAIGPGNVLGDLIGTGAVPVFRLNIIHRTDAASSIPLLARAINEGADTELEARFDGENTRFVPAPDAQSVVRWIGRHFTRYKDRVDEFQVLAPMKKGDAGVNNLNRVIAGIVRDPVRSGGRALVRDDYELRAGDRIIWTMNDKDLGLFNGEIGTLVEVLPNNGATVEFNEQRYKVPPEKVGNFSLAYALTVHKVQGSQFPVAIIALDGTLAHGQALSLYSRRLVYTAVTRARKTVAVVGQLKILREAVRRHDTHKRRTALAELVQAALTPAAQRV